MGSDKEKGSSDCGKKRSRPLSQDGSGSDRSTASSSSKSSYYSNNMLPENHSERRLNAADVRRQAAEAPTESKAKKEAKSYWAKNVTDGQKMHPTFPSPHKHLDHEGLGLKAGRSSSHVLAPRGSNYTQGDTKGASRAVYPKDDRTPVEVVTHKPADNSFAKATYRPAQHKSNKHKKAKTDDGKEGSVRK